MTIKDFIANLGKGNKKKEEIDERFTPEQKAMMENAVRDRQFELEIEKRLRDLERGYQDTPKPRTLLPNLTEYRQKNIAMREGRIQRNDMAKQRFRQMENNLFPARRTEDPIGLRPEPLRQLKTPPVRRLQPRTEPRLNVKPFELKRPVNYQEQSKPQNKKKK